MKDWKLMLKELKKIENNIKKEHRAALKRDDEEMVRFYFKAYDELKVVREKVKAGMEAEKKQIENLSEPEKKKRQKSIKDIRILKKKQKELDKKKKELDKRLEESNERTKKLKKRLKVLEGK